MSHRLIYTFDPEKNLKIIELRGISFEEIIAILENKDILDVVEHPNQARYPGQKIYVIEIDGYAYLVPFVEDGDKVFLKTAFPSRQATKQYLNSRGEL